MTTPASSASGIEQLRIALSNILKRIRDLEAAERTELAGLATYATTAGAVTSVLFAALPAAGTAGRLLYVSNGRKVGEGVGAGTGVLCYDDGVAWRTCDTSTTVAV